MTKITRGWPPERRAAQAARMKALKPWLKTTGPATAAGKEAVKNNALKHGFRSREYRELLALLRVQAKFVKDIIASHHHPDTHCRHPDEGRDLIEIARDSGLRQNDNYRKDSNVPS